MAKDETLTLTLTESVRVNGSPAVASLGADGTLRWRSEGGAGERCVTLEKEVLGLEAEGRTITVKAFGAAEAKVVSCCGGGGSGGVGRARRDYVLEMPSDESAARWSARLSDRINLLGRIRLPICF